MKEQQRLGMEQRGWLARQLLTGGNRQPSTSHSRYGFFQAKRHPSSVAVTECKTWQMLRALFALILAAQTTAYSESFEINWSTINGGGVASTGGVYSVTGTIGQPDANTTPVSGRQYSLTGGFWAIQAVQTAGSPLLSIFHTTTNTVVVAWPSPSSGWQLQQNTNSVNSVDWSNVSSTIQDDGTTKTFIVNPMIGNQFYRLWRP